MKNIANTMSKVMCDVKEDIESNNTCMATKGPEVYNDHIVMVSAYIKDPSQMVFEELFKTVYFSSHKFHEE